MASRSILVDWSNIQLFNFYSGNNYNKSFDNVKDYVSEKKNYEYFSPNEQIYIENVQRIFIFIKKDRRIHS
mgnify:CR=1 FL=1